MKRQREIRENHHQKKKEGLRQKDSGMLQAVMTMRTETRLATKLTVATTLTATMSMTMVTTMTTLTVSTWTPTRVLLTVVPGVTVRL